MYMFVTYISVTRPPDRRAYSKIRFFISQLMSLGFFEYHKLMLQLKDK